MVGAGSVVTGDVPPYAIVTGNPARIVGYADSRQPERIAPASPQPAPRSVCETSVPGAHVHTLLCAEDLRGKIAVGDLANDVPFPVHRFFVVYAVPSSHVRGEHAHKRCIQYLIAVSGSIRVLIDDGQTREEILLDSPTKGLLIPPMVWATQFHYTADAVLLVFASDPYDPEDYIRDYEEFLRLLGGTM
jgi:dTDP-4-dehydrorhamnose 3,5-epimerase-like enzyme